MENVVILMTYSLPLVIILLVYLLRSKKKHQISQALKEEALASGLAEPASLHPMIDPFKCIGCGSCVKACPENNVLGLIHHKAELIAPSHCIGHGACKAACPEDAISLVFGSETRGVDIPELTPEFETSVKGIFIAGELGGMGLIRNAIEQSTQAMKAIQKRYLKAKPSSKNTDLLDVLIVGSGPAGITAALYAKEHQLKYQVIEQDSLGGTVAHFPRGKIVMTAPAILPIVGKVKFTETTKETLLSFWQSVYDEQNLNINFQEKMLNIEKDQELFTIQSSATRYQARVVLLTIGRRGSPRTLDVPGEELSKVSYRLIDPAEFKGKKVLVVGGGDSALEAALSIAEEQGSEVIISYRSDGFSRAKAKNRQRIDEAFKAGSIKVLLESSVREIKPDSVDIQQKDKVDSYENDAVIVCAGGVLPTSLLKSIGISVSTKFGTA